jgi:transcriptional regulator GlxA family with amidase domain
MRRNVVKVIMGLFAVVVFGITGCGGGSGSSTTQTTGFTTAMISGKSLTSPHGTDVDTTTLKTDGTWIKTRRNSSNTVIGTTSGTWSINSNGQLISTPTATSYTDVVLNTPSTTTLVNYSSTAVTVSTSDGNTATLTFVDSTQTTGFTTAMLSGKSLTSPHGTDVDTTTLKADGTWIKTRRNSSNTVIGTTSGTWSINSNGQLISTPTATSYTDVVLNTPSTTTLVNYSSTAVTVSTSDGNTATLTYL